MKYPIAMWIRYDDGSVEYLLFKEKKDAIYSRAIKWICRRLKQVIAKFKR